MSEIEDEFLINLKIIVLKELCRVRDIHIASSIPLIFTFYLPYFSINPLVLLLGKPLNNLDLKSQLEVIDVVRNFVKDGKTVIVANTI